MTYLEVVYQYQTPPGEKELRAIDSVREVYGVQRIQFNETERTVRVSFDASRLKEEAVARLLRQAGIDVQDRVVLASPQTA
jgi:selenocysteine lyase/cysteine desulfurase